MHEYHLILADTDLADAAEKFRHHVMDAAVFLARLGDLAPFSDSGKATRIAVHDACHLLNSQGVRDEPRAARRDPACGADRSPRPAPLLRQRGNLQSGSARNRRKPRRCARANEHRDARGCRRHWQHRLPHAAQAAPCKAGRRDSHPPHDANPARRLRSTVAALVKARAPCAFTPEDQPALSKARLRQSTSSGTPRCAPRSSCRRSSCRTSRARNPDHA